MSEIFKGVSTTTSIAAQTKIMVRCDEYKFDFALHSLDLPGVLSCAERAVNGFYSGFEMEKKREQKKSCVANFEEKNRVYAGHLEEWHPNQNYVEIALYYRIFMQLHALSAYQSSGIQLNSVLLHTNILQQLEFVFFSLSFLAVATGTNRNERIKKNGSIYSTRSYLKSSFAPYSRFIGRNRCFFSFHSNFALSMCLQTFEYDFTNKNIYGTSPFAYDFNSIQ